MQMAGGLVPDETKANAVYGAIDKILLAQKNKYNVPIEEISANITKTKGALEVDIWRVIPSGELQWLGSVDKKELIKILKE